MTLSEEINNLQSLRGQGILTEEEFEKAKATIIAGERRTNDSNSQATPEVHAIVRVPWFFLFLVSIVLAAYVTNPDQASLEAICRENIERNQADAGFLERVATGALLDISYKRKDFYVFSIGTVESTTRIGGPKVTVEVLGTFGHWWFELLDTPLYETGSR